MQEVTLCTLFESDSHLSIFKCELKSNYYLYDYFYDSHSSDANGQMTYYDWSIYIINSLNLIGGSLRLNNNGAKLCMLTDIFVTSYSLLVRS